MRFPEFYGKEWIQHPLTDYLQFKNGLNPDAKRFGKGTKFISVMDILNNTFITYDAVRANVEANDKELEDFAVNYGDILFQRSSETFEDIGRSNVYLDIRACVFGGFVIRGKKIADYNPMFFKYLLDSPHSRKKVVVKGAGAQHFNISQDGLEKVVLPFPSKLEQEKISNFLALLDKRIELQKSAIEKLKSLKSAINNHLYDTCKEKVKTSIGELGQTYSGLSGKNANDFGSGAPFITYLNVFQNDVIDTAKFEKVRLGEGEKQNKVQYGDALFTLSSETPEEVGYGSVYLGKEDVYLNSFCFGLHINRSDLVYAPYLSCLFNTRYFRKFVYPLAQGSTRYNLQKSDFERKALELPSYKYQKTIYQIYNSISEKIKTETELLEKYMEQKQYLLGKMFI